MRQRSNKKAIQEKSRLDCETIDGLNAWLEKIEKEIASQESIAEDVSSLKAQMKSMKTSFRLSHLNTGPTIEYLHGLFKLELIVEQ